MRSGSRRISPSCRSYSKVLSLRPRSREEFRHANDDENHLSGLLNWCSRDWHTHTCQRSILSTARVRLGRWRRLPLRLLLPSSDMDWMPAGVDGSGRKLRTLQRSGRWWLEHPEWMPTRLHRTGWKLRALPIWKVNTGRKLTCERRGAPDRGEYRQAAGAVAEALSSKLVTSS